MLRWTWKRCFLAFVCLLISLFLVPDPLHDAIRRTGRYNRFDLLSLDPFSIIYPSSPPSKPSAPMYTPSTNCTEWLQETNETIIYPYGVFQSDSGAPELRGCIASKEAVGARTGIRHIAVAFPLSGTPPAYQKPLQDIMLSLENLETVRWASSCGRRGIINDLTKWAREHKPNVETTSIDRTIPLFEECQDNLEVFASYDGDNSPYQVDQAYNILSSCTRTKSLSLSIAQVGCTIGWSNPFSFNFKRRDTFPNLENLTLSGYRWDDTSRNKQGSVASWKSHMDWSHLRSLNVDLPPVSFLNAFSGEDVLQNLTSLTLRHKWNFWGDETTLCNFDNETTSLRANYTAFITSLSPLRELSVSGTGAHLDFGSILSRHGASLLKLSIHEFERDCADEKENPSWTRPFLSHGEIAGINAAAPNLRALELDVYRGEDRWPTQTFRTLAAFPALRELTMHFDLENPERDMRNPRCMAWGGNPEQCEIVTAVREPRLNLTSAKMIFEELKEEGSGVRNLTATVGEYGRRKGGGLRFEPNYVPIPRKISCWSRDGSGGGSVKCEGWDGDWVKWNSYGVRLQE